MFPEVNELLKDEEVVVQNAAIESLAQLLSFLSSDIRQAQVLPFIRSCAPQLPCSVYSLPQAACLSVTPVFNVRVYHKSEASQRKYT